MLVQGAMPDLRAFRASRVCGAISAQKATRGVKVHKGMPDLRGRQGRQVRKEMLGFKVPEAFPAQQVQPARPERWGRRV